MLCDASTVPVYTKMHNTRSLMKKVLLLTAIMLFCFSSAFALPNLQLYIPGGTFDSETETWVIGSSDFELWVVADLYDGSFDPTHRADLWDIYLVAALAQGTDSSAGNIDIFELGNVTPETNDMWRYGTPPPSETPSIGGHGIYPTWYTQILVAESTVGMAATDSLYDYQDDITGPKSMGIIFKYFVSTTFDYVHFDAYGYTEPDGGKTDRTVAPFSHDAEMVPEPTTILLFGLGLGVVGIARRRK